MKQHSTILIVDDDNDFTTSLSAFLQRHGLRTLVAGDGNEALRLASHTPPDLIIMDIMLTERTEGFFTIQQMRHTPELAATPLFVLSAIYSADSGFAVPPDQKWLAHDEFFSKPVNLHYLLGRIRMRLGVAS